MFTLIEGLIVIIGVHIQEKQIIGETLIFLNFKNWFKGEGGGEAFQRSTTPPLGSGPAMTCKFQHKRQEIKYLPRTATSKGIVKNGLLIC